MKPGPVRCARCGRRAVIERVGPDGVAAHLCRAHRNVRPCSMCGSLKHAAGNTHPQFWGTKEERDRFRALHYPKEKS